MRPLFTVGVGLVAACHFAFLLYLVGGGFLAAALRKAHRHTASTRALGLHIATVGWAVASTAGGLWCPLTSVERWLRSRAGMAPMPPSGFIDHYLVGALYPEWASGYVQFGVFFAVAVSWAIYAVTRHRTGAESTPKRIS